MNGFINNLLYDMSIINIIARTDSIFEAGNKELLNELICKNNIDKIIFIDLNNYSNRNQQSFVLIHHKPFQHYHFHKMGLIPNPQFQKFEELVV